MAYNDVDFCLKVLNAGYINVWTHYTELYHHESVSRGKVNTPEKLQRFQKEKQYMLNEWPEIITDDPCYNKNLTLSSEDFTIK